MTPQRTPPQYDAIGTAYEPVKHLSMAYWPEREGVLEAVGPLVDASLLDVACGTGFYTRLLSSRGTGRTVGVDISEAMVRTAMEREREQSLGIEYRVADARKLTGLGQFDVVSAVYLLNYAADIAEMVAMSTSVAEHLRPGGRFCVLTQNPDFDFSGPSPEKYGFTFDDIGRGPLGPRVRITAKVERPVTFETSIPNRAAYSEAIRVAGLGELEWLPMPVSHDARSAHPAGYWDDFLANPPLAVFRCRA